MQGNASYSNPYRMTIPMLRNGSEVMSIALSGGIPAGMSGMMSSGIMSSGIPTGISGPISLISEKPITISGTMLSLPPSMNISMPKHNSGRLAKANATIVSGDESGFNEVELLKALIKEQQQKQINILKSEPIVSKTTLKEIRKKRHGQIAYKSCDSLITESNTLISY